MTKRTSSLVALLAIAVTVVLCLLGFATDFVFGEEAAAKGKSETQGSSQPAKEKQPITLPKTASFRGLGSLAGGRFASQAYAVSADGSVVVGQSTSALRGEAFRWTDADGMTGLGHLPDSARGRFSSSEARAVSADGLTVAGYCRLSQGWQGFRWTSSSGMVGLGDLPGGKTFCRAYDVSADGSVVIGGSSSTSSGDDYEAFRWTADGGMVGLGDLKTGKFNSYGQGVSADGTVVVGTSASASGPEAFRWTQAGGMMALGDLPGGDFCSRAFAVSADGSVVVGRSISAAGQEAFRWTKSEGMQGLGDLPGGDFHSCAWAASADGSVVVGAGTSASGMEAFIWDANNGVRNLKDVLEKEYALDLAGWTLGIARGISDDGLTIVGRGRNANRKEIDRPQGKPKSGRPQSTKGRERSDTTAGPVGRPRPQKGAPSERPSGRGKRVDSVAFEAWIATIPSTD
jgi:probable HAF family extracellular repeat protein